MGAIQRRPKRLMDAPKLGASYISPLAARAQLEVDGPRGGELRGN